jgi:electron transport complex protein RnfE
VRRAVADGLGMGAGFTLSLALLSTIREVLGKGAILGHPLFGPRFEPWVFMMLPPGGFLALGIALLGVAWVMERRKRHAREAVA